MINKPIPPNRDYSRDPNIKAFKRRGFINHGSTLVCSIAEAWRRLFVFDGKPVTASQA